MEQPLEQARQLLGEKSRLFGLYEQATDRLSNAQMVEDMEKEMQERETLANSIDEIDREVKYLLQPWGQQATQLLTGQLATQELSSTLEPLVTVCGEIMERVRRIRLKNADIEARFVQLRQDSLQQIKNTQNQPKISRYLSNLSGNGETGNPLGKV